ncbi:SGNH/GDSL hydrolase family protein [Actinokineospora xionganensis]|uniref:SGNH/GDSL hydrolase family protein n=1 Tax=Actinokineospora xionganensis TaxID=2684470 RepID=A0ABR7L3K3_9PSEU|nr:SGNH/GDSL hydrolase family protein [Actinokineospora xionganensis]MBC6447266.1 SGNH/GDSL hydrolase family protein [Actinokineospora xionganensis]
MTSFRVTRVLTAAVAAVLLLSPTPAAATEQHHGPAWVGSWSMSAELPNEFTFEPNWSEAGFDNHTVRQTVRVSTGGDALRVKLSNVYGSTPLRVSGAAVAKAAEGASVRPGTARPVTFGGSRSVTIPAGRELFSDPVWVRTSSLERLSVSLYFAQPTGPATFHAWASETAYRAVGDHRFARDGKAFTETTPSNYYLTAVDVVDFGNRARRAVVAFGDSLTDGSFSTLGADNRYPDELAERLVAAGKPMGVRNAGLAGNRMLDDSLCFGDKAVARFQRDVLDVAGVRTVIVSEGINDIIALTQTEWHPCGPGVPDLTAQRLIESHRELIRLAHARGLRIIGGTVLPYKGNPYEGVYSEEGEAIRDALNEWIRTSGEYDAVADFDRAVADPADPDEIRDEFDGGDKIHVNDAGYRAMAEAIDLATL